MTTDKEDENVDRCESCLQILDPATPLPRVRLLSIDEIIVSNSVDEKKAILDPKVNMNSREAKTNLVFNLKNYLFLAISDHQLPCELVYIYVKLKLRIAFRIMCFIFFIRLQLMERKMKSHNYSWMTFVYTTNMGI